MMETNKYITEPNMEKVRKKVYDEWKKVYDESLSEVEDLAYKLYSPKIDEAYQRGLKDAWECAKKISIMDSPTRDEIFGLVITSNIIDENSAPEAIEKIRQYEQEQEERIDSDKNKVEALANDIGIHKLFALVKEIRGE